MYIFYLLIRKIILFWYWKEACTMVSSALHLSILSWNSVFLSLLSVSSHFVKGCMMMIMMVHLFQHAYITSRKTLRDCESEVASDCHASWAAVEVTVMQTELQWKWSVHLSNCYQSIVTQVRLNLHTQTSSSRFFTCPSFPTISFVAVLPLDLICVTVQGLSGLAQSFRVFLFRQTIFQSFIW